MSRRPLAPTLVGLALTLAGCSLGTGQSTHVTLPPSTSTTAPAPMPAIEPSQLIIDRISVNAPMRPLGLAPDGTIAVPDLDHAQDVTWFCDHHAVIDRRSTCGHGAIPGQVAPAIITGHVDSHQTEGVFFRLKELTPGDAIQVRRVDGSTLTFKVTKVESMPKSAFRTAAVYGDVQHPAIRLITCGGQFDKKTGNYMDNVVAYADLVT